MRRLVALFVGILFFTCSVQGVGLAQVLQAPRAALPPPPAAATAAAAPVTAMQPVAGSLTDYRLGPGDKVKVTTFGEEALTGEFLVGSTGMVALPLVGELSAAGRTAREFQDVVETALKDGYLKEPKVSIEVLNLRPYYILGEVNRPGGYPYSGGLTVLNAVATAGGFTYRANNRKVFIRRDGEAREQEVPLTSTTTVQPGDTIRIAERFF